MILILAGIATGKFLGHQSAVADLEKLKQALAEINAMHLSVQPSVSGQWSPNNDVDQQLMATVTKIVQQSPEINPDSPQYNQNVVDAIAQKRNQYLQAGKPPPDALVLAYNDYVAGKLSIVMQNNAR